MKYRKTPNKILLGITLGALLLIFLSGSYYIYWNAASPERTCASCHEIANSVMMLSQSSHRELRCAECHGTALSNGLHSLREKGMMVSKHFGQKKVEDIKLNEEQILAVMGNCTRCHTAEYAGWKSGGHSAKYSDIFLNKEQNETEQINPDCLRCHGMFSDLPVDRLVQPLDLKGPWTFMNSKTAGKPVIPCLTCHQIHNTGLPEMNPDYSIPRDIFYTRKPSNVKVSFYYRPDRINIPGSYLPNLNLWENDRKVNVSDDVITRNCIQCHSPDARHQAGTSDDRTPRGVHEGIGCISCHEAHSNRSENSCIKCHPAISNCNLDVNKMNTSFSDRQSPNNVHWVSCTDCHKEEGFKRK